jgi:hypothetical protein
VISFAFIRRRLLYPGNCQDTHVLERYLVGNANDAAGRTAASIASLQRISVVPLAEIISTIVNDDGAANNALGTDQLDEPVGHGALGVAVSIRLDVAEITDVTLLIGGSTVGLVVRVEVRTGRSAAIGVITKSMDVEAALSVGGVASDVPRDGRGRRLVSLLEEDGTRDTLVSTEDCDCIELVQCS